MNNKIILGGGLAAVLTAGLIVFQGEDESSTIAKHVLCRSMPEGGGEILYKGVVDSNVVHTQAEGKFTFTTREGDQKDIIGHCMVEQYQDVPGQDVKTLIDNTGGN